MATKFNTPSQEKSQPRSALAFLSPPPTYTTEDPPRLYRCKNKLALVIQRGYITYGIQSINYPFPPKSIQVCELAKKPEKSLCVHIHPSIHPSLGPIFTF
ncbi:hypothetical protein EYC84_006669 [Monilinia fructicola]|uniref:Uncharacterized protein n=1 Tax=Monilinia fructicola TaxID=38448 RepID=A0A5M9K8K8_MONFR|nr:hypothetical protein EYC84_006669 [Monilinia fructicola]